jgi:hypothetical protein
MHVFEQVIEIIGRYQDRLVKGTEMITVEFG